MKNLIVLDCEVFPNYFLVSFKNLDNGKNVSIDMYGADTVLTEDQRKKLHNILAKYQTFGFNSDNYDMPIMLYALKNKTCKEICQLSNHIINGTVPTWMVKQQFGLSQPKQYVHFDISQVCPGVRASLKLYGARIHCKRLQDLPIEPNTILTKEQADEIKLYCVNDLDTTIELFEAIKESVLLRVDMTKQYGINLMSKSDAQIAEQVIKSELSKLSPGRRFKAPELPEDYSFMYTVPKFIKFNDEALKQCLIIIRNYEFVLNKQGKVDLPKELRDMKIKLGSSTYQMGIGGLHSKDNSETIEPNENQVLIDKDVAAFYPSIILNSELFPRHLGKKFLEVYSKIVDTRLEAKANGWKQINASLKIVINGTYGKLASQYSIVYSPDLSIAVTLTGQLVLLMLIEKLEENGINVVSGNTDGFVSLMGKGKVELFEEICAIWEQTTGYVLEATNYKGLYSRDVNNYLAITDYGWKGRGIFKIDALDKNPQANICSIAVQKLLSEGIPISRTIRECEDVGSFLTVRTVNGGAIYKDEYLGKVVRWIWSTKGDTIRYKKNGHKVPKSDGSRPIMTIGDFPRDIDYNRYIEESHKILDDIGLTKL